MQVELTDNEVEETQKRLNDYFQMNCHVILDDLEITSTPGYWENKKPCGGLLGGCKHPMHGLLFNEGGTKHTVSYYDSWKDEKTGRIVSIYHSWRLMRSLKKESEK